MTLHNDRRPTVEDQKKFIAHVDEDGMLDVSTEEYRTYHYPNGVTLTITRPKALHVKRRDDGTDSHRLIDKDRRGWYVRPGWLAIEWYNEAGDVRVNW